MEHQDIFSSNGNKESLEIVFSEDKMSLLTVAWARREMEKNPYSEYETSTKI